MVIGLVDSNPRRWVFPIHFRVFPRSTFFRDLVSHLALSEIKPGKRTDRLFQAVISCDLHFCPKACIDFSPLSLYFQASRVEMKSFKRLLGKATKPFCLSSEGVVPSYNSFRVLEKALQRESCKSVGNETHVEWKIKLEPNRTSTLLGRSRPYNLISAPLPFAVASIDLLITSSASTSNGSAESSTVTASEPYPSTSVFPKKMRSFTFAPSENIRVSFHTGAFPTHALIRLAHISLFVVFRPRLLLGDTNRKSKRISVITCPTRHSCEMLGDQ